ncbi:MAG: sulfur carrier protein ThiS [Chloracidobacterium sp.]|uniref:Sulfur carrier protein ThiS n=1 Tax=Chloracidobacterium validum TaxID=2821543 RepID=A0ABX8BBP3_9BACT|nr:sulfur carrier protein ThiS [Chloracidobacterium validum]QUW03074.1 sulfur carrier protein ThiS [Chloracidobacterium validum]
MTIIINGEHHTVPEPLTLADLVDRLNLTDARRIAIEYNGELSARSTWAEVTLTDGDRLEIVHLVGGG